MSAVPLDREEFVEQAYFFRVFRERLAGNHPAQEILEQIHQEILSTTRLPLAIQFLATELKHSGLLATGMERLAHYFTGFQAFVVRQAEQEGLRFTMPIALSVLEREATYKANQPTKPGLFVYQFETICRNRLGYTEGLRGMSSDPIYDPIWRHFIESLPRQLGILELSDILYLRSELHAMEHRRENPKYEPSLQPLFGEKEGKIAKASRGRDPLFLFAALQRQLNYPEVPKPKPRDDASTKIELMEMKMREMETRIKLLEGEMRGNVDLSQFMTPDALKGLGDD
jgi:hypothetical protein